MSVWMPISYVALGLMVAGAALHSNKDPDELTAVAAFVLVATWPAVLLLSLGAAIGRRIDRGGR